MTVSDQQTQPWTYTRMTFRQMLKLLAPPLLGAGAVAAAAVGWFFGLGSAGNVFMLAVVLLAAAIGALAVLEHRTQPLPYTPVSRVAWVIHAHLQHMLDDLVLYQACTHTRPELGCVCHLHAGYQSR